MTATVIAISQGKGGACKTTSSVNLAGALRERGFTVIVGDMDKDKPDAWKWKNQGETIDWIELLDDENPVNKIDNLKETCDILILDTPPNYMALALKAVMLSDFVIIPVSSSFMDKNNAKDAISIPLMAKKPFKILMSNIKKGTKEGKNLNNPDNFDSAKFNTYITNRNAMMEAVENGKWIGDFKPKSDNHMQFLNLADEVICWINLKPHTCAVLNKEEVVL